MRSYVDRGRRSRYGCTRVPDGISMQDMHEESVHRYGSFCPPHQNSQTINHGTLEGEDERKQRLAQSRRHKVLRPHVTGRPVGGLGWKPVKVGGKTRSALSSFNSRMSMK